MNGVSMKFSLLTLLISTAVVAIAVLTLLQPYIITRFVLFNICLLAATGAGIVCLAAPQFKQRTFLAGLAVAMFCYLAVSSSDSGRTFLLTQPVVDYVYMHVNETPGVAQAPANPVMYTYTTVAPPLLPGQAEKLGVDFDIAPIQPVPPNTPDSTAADSTAADSTPVDFIPAPAPADTIPLPAPALPAPEPVTSVATGPSTLVVPASATSPAVLAPPLVGVAPRLFAAAPRVDYDAFTGIVHCWLAVVVGLLAGGLSAFIARRRSRRGGGSDAASSRNSNDSISGNTISSSTDSAGADSSGC